MFHFFNWQHDELVIKHPVPQETWIKIERDLFRLYGQFYAC